MNEDGLQSADEPGFPGVTVILHEDGGSSRSTVTDDVGFYEFINLDPYTFYSLEFVNPELSTYTFTQLDAGPDNVDNDADPFGLTISFQVPAGTRDDTRDAGLVGPNIMIVGDTDRNGTVTVADELGRAGWTKVRGAIFAVNYDDDNKNGKSDAVEFNDKGEPVNEDFVLENADDAAQSAPLVIRRTGALPAGWKVFLKMEEKEEAQAVHVFKRREAGETAILGRIGDRVPGAAAAPLEVDITAFVSPTEDVTFGVEGLLFRGMTPAADAMVGTDLNFNGIADFDLELRNAAGVVIREDRARMKVAPWVMLSNQEASQDVWAVDAGVSNETFRVTGKADPGYVGLDDSKQLQTYTEAARWAQDHAEIGYTQRPGAPKIYSVFRR